MRITICDTDGNGYALDTFLFFLPADFAFFDSLADVLGNRICSLQGSIRQEHRKFFAAQAGDRILPFHLVL